jgi:hypothetical protein
MSDVRKVRERLYNDLGGRIANGGFAVALSGGGHRATLATLGALMAIIDRGLGPKIIQVASVSGGTITNAFVAQRCHLEKLGPRELDGVARQLARTIIRKGVLTRAWLVFLLSGPIVLSIAAAITLRITIVPWAWLCFVIGLGIALSLLMGTGLVVEWLLDRRYFRHGAEFSRYCNRARLVSLSEREVDHVFCMTDLALGLPVYASSRGGMIWRRLKSGATQDGQVEFQPFDATQRSIAELTRASAAFPGIPPRRLKIPP